MPAEPAAAAFVAVPVAVAARPDHAVAATVAAEVVVADAAAVVAASAARVLCGITAG